MRSCRIIVVGLFGLLMAGAASASEPTECDRLAGSPTDPNRVGAGIGLYGIEPAEAITACERALAADPHNPRLLYNLGRAHVARSLLDNQPEQKAQAGQSFRAAADPQRRSHWRLSIGSAAAVSSETPARPCVC
jgi:hypothetical protein